MSISIRAVTVAALSCALSSGAAADDKVTYEDHVKPVFRAKCFSCHNTNKKTADLDLSNYTALMQGGASGAVIEPGDADNSYLFMLMAHTSEPFMPPNADRVPDEMLSIVKKWIDSGAPETASSRVMLPKKPAVDLTVDVSAGARPDGPPPLPDVLDLAPVTVTAARDAVSAVATSPWAKLVAVAGQQQVLLYHSETLEPLGVLPFPEGQARVLKFSRSGKLLLAGGGHGASKGLAVVWNIETGERIIEAGDELDEVLAADISADQSLIALGGPGRVVRVYSTATKELVYEVTKHTDWIYSLEFSPDGVLLATADRAGGLLVWEAHTGREYLNLTGHTGPVTAVSWRIDGNVLASASEDASVRLWEMEEGRNIKNWNAHGGGVFDLEFCRDGRLVTCGRDKVAKLWQQDGKQLRQFEAFSDLALRVTHCDESDRIIAGDWTGEIRVWAAADGTRTGTLESNPPSLTERLSAAQQAIPALQQAVEAARSAQTAAAAARDQAMQLVEQAKAAHQAQVEAKAAMAAGLKTSQEKMAATTKERSVMAERLAALQKASPEVAAAIESTAAVATMMSDDPQLKATLEQLQSTAARLTEETKQNQASVAALDATMKELNAGIAKINAEMPAADKRIADAEQQIAARTEGLKQPQEKLAAADAAVARAQQALNEGNSRVERWQQYIALHEELVAMKAAAAARDEQQLAMLESQAVVTEMKEEQDAVMQTIAAQQKIMADARAAAEKLQADLETYGRQQADNTAMMELLNKAVPQLEAAAAQAGAAATMLPTDEGLKQSVAALQATVKERTAQREAVQKTLTDIAASMQQATAEMAEANQTMQTAAAEAEKQNTMLVSLTKEAEPKQAEAATAEEEFRKAEEAFRNALAVVEARKAQLRPSAPISQASSN